LIFRAAPALFSLVLFVPFLCRRAENEDMAVLRRMLGELKAENRKLSQRLSALEGASTTRRTVPAAAHERPGTCRNCGETPHRRLPSPPVVLPSPDLSETATNKPLGQRVKDLEIGWAAQENATRQIIQEHAFKDRAEDQ